jgi:uncharacterized cupin superfamily protein
LAPFAASAPFAPERIEEQKIRGALMPKIDIETTPTVSGSRYPTPFDIPCQQRFRRRLGDAVGLSQFGVNLTRLSPGAWSSQRHWHTGEDEFVYIVEGEPPGVSNGHHLQNRSGRDVLFLEVGSRRPDDDEAYYPDIDLHATKGRSGYVHRDGRPYPGAKPRNPATGK